MFTICFIVFKLSEISHISWLYIIVFFILDQIVAGEIENKGK